MSTFVDWVVTFDKEQEHREATRMVFSHIDTLLLKGQFADVDAILAECIDRVGEMSTFLIRSLLVITMPARRKLDNRNLFFNVGYERAKALKPDKADAILEGLR